MTGGKKETVSGVVTYPTRHREGRRDSPGRSRVTVSGHLRVVTMWG